MIDDFKRPPERKPVRIDSFGDRLNASGASPDRPQQPSWQPQPTVIQPRSESAAVAAVPSPISGIHNNVFTSPEAVSEKEQSSFIPPLETYGSEHTVVSTETGQPKRRFAFLRKPDLSKKQWIILSSVIFLLIGGAMAFALTREEEKPVPKKLPVKAAPVPKPKPITSPLSGLVVTKEQQARPVTGVMIENSNNARPQSGLDQSGVVFEAISEYGVTRFLAL